ATTGGPLILASSPHARRGVLWEVFKRHYGPDGDPLTLVAHGPQRVVDRALEKDRARATAEYLAEFRADLETYLDIAVVEGWVGGHREMLPAAGTFYYSPSVIQLLALARILSPAPWPTRRAMARSSLTQCANFGRSFPLLP